VREELVRAYARTFGFLFDLLKVGGTR
jgi:hypothetical protein